MKNFPIIINYQPNKQKSLRLVTILNKNKNCLLVLPETFLSKNFNKNLNYKINKELIKPNLKYSNLTKHIIGLYSPNIIFELDLLFYKNF